MNEAKFFSTLFLTEKAHYLFGFENIGDPKSREGSLGLWMGMQRKLCVVFIVIQNEHAGLLESDFVSSLLCVRANIFNLSEDRTPKT